jgi:hypothetical protein|tara:strand:+ start:145 stop:258 length:114 start_codon:yes stop_codon:yes gene_type:complete
MFKDLILIILGAGISSAYYFFKSKKEIKKQERLNKIQ